MSHEPGTPIRLTAWTGVLLTVRFVLEILLLAAYAVIGTALAEGWLGWVLAALLVLIVAVVWGAWLAPKRRIDSSLRVRIALELALFLLAGIGLALVGDPAWGLVLVVAEVVAVALLRTPGEHVEGHPTG